MSSDTPPSSEESSFLSSYVIPLTSNVIVWIREAIASLAEALDDTQMALRIGKTAVAQGVHLLYYAYPVHPFPAYQPLREPPRARLAPAQPPRPVATVSFS